ncbi:J domain-containing protein [Phenylobacterium sp. J367]|uniref:J domain-containing protein n=1 Tax=Phenylobacterium sp. J367 TaxID=2898435 RepID=UPI002151CEC4|nr:J domain-containing protein [Phenylobacterium sp. J367]MCR5878783.1 molecular chaperone DnaJ [Phenylobacterium sp. J367]
MSPTARSMTARAAREALGVGALAGPGEIRRAFREAAKAAHPDRPGGSAERFRQVVDAYHRLQGEPRPQDRFVQPPARREPVAAELCISPLTALKGGSAEHRLADGRTIRIKLPPGLRTGDTVRAGETELPVVVRSEGDMILRGDDLWLTVSVTPPRPGRRRAGGAGDAAGPADRLGDPEGRRARSRAAGRPGSAGARQARPGPPLRPAAAAGELHRQRGAQPAPALRRRLGGMIIPPLQGRESRAKPGRVGKRGPDLASQNNPYTPHPGRVRDPPLP